MFQILDFQKYDNPTLNLCLGVVGYLMKDGKDEKHYTFVPAKFIQSLSRKAKCNLIDYLIDNNYIIKVEREPDDEDKKLKSFYFVNKFAYKKKPNIYYLTAKIFELNETVLQDESIEKTVITNLHHLYFQSFNHWAHNYRHIQINITDEVLEEAVDNEFLSNKFKDSRRPKSFHIENLKTMMSQYGNLEYKNYDIAQFGIENHWERVSNVFTICNPILRKHTSIEQPIEIGIKYSEGVIIADQLLKAFGENDFSRFFIDRAKDYKIKLEKILNENKNLLKKGKKPKRKPDALNKVLFELPEEDYYQDINTYFVNKENEINEEKKKVQSSVLKPKKLFNLPNDDERAQLEYIMQETEDLNKYVLPDEKIEQFLSRHKQLSDFYRNEIVKAIFGYKHSSFFHKFFPGTWSDILFHIKAGNSDYFERFVSVTNKKRNYVISKKDYRIQLMRNREYLFPYSEDVYQRGQIYFKVVSLLWTIREKEIMMKIWGRLKRLGIKFIPINDKVLVSNYYKDAVENVTLNTWREYLDRRILIFPEITKHY